MARPGPSRSTTASSDTLQSITVDTVSAGGYSSNTTASTTTENVTNRASSSSERVKRVVSLKEARVSDEESTSDKKGRTISGETLVENNNGSQSSLLQQGLAALNLPWSMSSLFAKTSEDSEVTKGPSFGESMESLAESETPRSVMMKERAERVRAKREKEEMELADRARKDNEKATRRSTRVNLLDRASSVVDRASSILGKRSRDVLERSKDKLEELKRTASLRPRDGNPSDQSGFEGPLAKRVRLKDSRTPETAETGKTVTRKPVPRAKAKRWLSHGLYVGQNRNFDPRLTDEKNRKKLARKPEMKERKILPLPMFAGQRLLERGRDFKLPFEVFSPLPPGQPKPDEWKKTNKNVFVGDAGSIWRNTKLQETSRCICSAETGCDDDCMNRFMFYECDDTNCRLDAETCGNRSFEGLKQRVKKGGKYNVGVEVIKTFDRGYGVRSNRTFESNQIIVEYTGEIITQDECEDRMNTLYKDNECYYLMLFDQNMIIDATRGSIARFVNHSCEPNCKMEKWTVAGKPRMALFAGDKGIMTGEELTYDYNFDPFSQKNVQECRCGVPSCRGVLGPKPKDQSKPKEAKEANATGLTAAKRKIQEVLDESTSKLNKKRKTIAAVSVRAKYASAKARTTKKLVRARAYTSNAASKERLVKKVSSRSIASAKVPIRRPSAAKRLTNAIKKRGSVRTSSASSSMTALVETKSTRNPSRRESVRGAASLAKRNIVSTVRGAAGGRGRTIRPISAGTAE